MGRHVSGDVKLSTRLAEFMGNILPAHSRSELQYDSRGGQAEGSVFHA